MFSPDLMRCAAARSCLPHLLLITFSSLWALAASAAPKTDIVFFKNGDKLTGEIRSLGRGRLNLNTDATGTISIEWDKISGIVSDQHIQFETASGIRYFGSVKTSEKVSDKISGIVSDQHIQFDRQRYSNFGSVKTSEKVSEIIVVTWSANA